MADPRKWALRIFGAPIWLGHALVMGLALSIPLVLAWQTVRFEGQWSGEPWLAAFHDLGRWLDLVQNTLIVGGSAVLLSTCLGLVLAVAGFKIRWRGRSVLVLLVVLVVCVPPYVPSTCLFSLIGLPPGFDARLAAGVIHGLMYFPLAALVLGFGLRSVDASLEEAALLEQSPWGVIWTISLRRCAWSIAAAMLLSFLLVITDYAVTDFLQVRTFAEEAYTQYQLEGERTTPFLLALPVLFVLGLIFWLLERRARWLSGPLLQGHVRRAFCIDIGLKGIFAAWTLTVLLMVALGWAFSRLVVQLALGRTSEEAAWWTDVQAIYPEWLVTIRVALVTGLLVAFLSVGFAWMLARSRKWQTATRFMVLGLLSVPAPALAMSLIGYFNHPTPAWLAQLFAMLHLNRDPISLLYGSSFMYVLTFGLRFLPVAILIVLPAINRVPFEVDEAARSDGAGWLELVYRIYFPQCLPNAVLAGLVISLLAIGELTCAVLVAPPGQATLSIRLFTFLHSGLGSQVAVVCVASTLTALPPALIVFYMSRKTLLWDQ